MNARQYVIWKVQLRWAKKDKGNFPIEECNRNWYPGLSFLKFICFIIFNLQYIKFKIIHVYTCIYIKREQMWLIMTLKVVGFLAKQNNWASCAYISKWDIISLRKHQYGKEKCQFIHLFWYRIWCYLILTNLTYDCYLFLENFFFGLKGYKPR